MHANKILLPQTTVLQLYKLLNINIPSVKKLNDGLYIKYIYICDYTDKLQVCMCFHFFLFFYERYEL